jgi:hypothetical protein
MRDPARLLRGLTMAWTTDYVRTIVNQLAVSSEQGNGSDLTAEAVNLALAALRAYRGGLVALRSGESLEGFQIEAIDDLDLPREVLAATPDESIARAALAEAKKRFPDRNIVLRGATSSGKIKAPVVRRGPYKVQGRQRKGQARS